MTKVEKRFTVSRMTEADAAEAAVIDAEVYTTPWSERSFSDSLKKDCYLFLTVRGEGPEILGYCGLVQSFDEADITNVTVRGKARGQGIAFLMLNELMEEGRKRGRDQPLFPGGARLQSAGDQPVPETGFLSGRAEKEFLQSA